METVNTAVWSLLEHEKLVTWLLTALAALATAALGKLGWSVPKGWAAQSVGRAWSAVLLAVQSVQQTYVDDVKRFRSLASDGGAALTESERREAKRRAKEKIRTYLGGTKLLSLALWILGLKGGADPWLDDAIESTVQQLRGSATSPGNASPSSAGVALPPSR